MNFQEKSIIMGIKQRRNPPANRIILLSKINNRFPDLLISYGFIHKIFKETPAYKIIDFRHALLYKSGSNKRHE